MRQDAVARGHANGHDACEIFVKDALRIVEVQVLAHVVQNAVIAVFLLDHETSRARRGGENLGDVTAARANRIHDGALSELFGEFFREVCHRVQRLEQVIGALLEIVLKVRVASREVVGHGHDVFASRRATRNHAGARVFKDYAVTDGDTESTNRSIVRLCVRLTVLAIVGGDQWEIIQTKLLEERLRGGFV